MDDQPGVLPPGTCYLLPEPTYHQLQDTRDHLRLLARLTAATTIEEDEEGVLNLRRALLAQCFQHLAERLDAALGEVVWPL